MASFLFFVEVVDQAVLFWWEASCDLKSMIDYRIILKKEK